ncbi:TonB-dependent receptor [Novosphingobium lentum]|uniref:TonB-dependent receptor n=1 Tax=Novosphingobium lentum TaxID=145287 RepID=UPI0008352A5A|nr:TonB-dependent receptor [Novosphingobium lentum]
MLPVAVLAAALTVADAPAPSPAPIVVTAPGGAIDAEEASGIDAAAIMAGARSDLAAALRREAPGVTLADAEGNEWQQGVIWRGYGASAVQGTEQGLAVYLDGIRFNQPFGDTLALDLLPEAMLVRAELRAASPVYGRNALGGVVLLQSASARDLPGVRASVNGDSIGGVGGSASIGVTRGSDSVLVAGDAIRDPGWRDASASRLYRLGTTLTHDGANWGFALRANAADTRLGGDGVAPVELLAARYVAVFTQPDTTRSRYARIALQPWVDLGRGNRIEGSVHLAHLHRTSGSGDLAEFDACPGNPATLCATGDAGAASPLLDPAGHPVAFDPAIPAYGVLNRGDEHTTSGGVSVQWLSTSETDKGTRRIALGMVHERADTRFRAVAALGSLGADRAIGAIGPDGGTVLSTADGAITPVDVASHLRDTSLFGEVALPLTATLRLEAGARWAVNRVTLDDQLGTALNGSHRFARLNPSVELDYTPAPAIELHAGFATTSRTPTPAELSCADPAAPCALASFFVADPPLRQVIARHWSAGVRHTGDALSWHVELWRTDTSDDIRRVASTISGRAFFVNGGRSRRQGVELSARWQRGGWQVSAGYAFTDARFRDGFVASSPNNPAADPDGTISVSPGARLPGLPRHSANLDVSYQRDGWLAGLSIEAQSGQVLVGDESNANAPLPGFAIAGLRLRRSWSSGLAVTAQVTNLFDKRYATFGTFAQTGAVVLAEAPGATNPRAYAPGAPRRLRVSVAARF